LHSGERIGGGSKKSLEDACLCRKKVFERMRGEGLADI